MTANRADGLETRRRLLDAAGALFADKGFRDTKTADICRMAKANVAAVNYHFRSKEDLYVAAWRHEFDRSIAAYPPDGGVASDAPAAERLRGHIHAMVRRFMDPTSRDLDIAHREMSNPTGLLAEVIHSSFEPLRQMHLGIVRELLGPGATEQDEQLCEMSIHAQCFAALMHERHRRAAPPGVRRAGPPMLRVGGEALAEHVARFSLAGIREVRRIAKLCLLVPMTLLFGGCFTAGPDYKQPAFGTPTNWSARLDGAIASAPSDPAALSRWWDVFGDPVLTHLVESARRNNLDVKQAEARLRKARAQRGLAGAEQLPTVSVDASAGRSRSSAKAGSGVSQSTYVNSLDASWELDLFGAKRRAVESAGASLEASQEDLRDVQVSLLAEVALNYVQYRSCQTRLAILSTNLAAQTETYTITGWRHQANLVTQLDVDQARVSLEQTRAQIPVLRTSLDHAEHQLATLLGEAPGALAARLAVGPATVPAAASELAMGVPADVLRQRPDVRAAERRLAAQTAQIGVAAAARFPDLTLSGSIGLEALALGDLYTAGARTARGLLDAGLTVLDGGRVRQSIAVQTALQEEVLAAYEAAVLTALKDVEDALVAYSNEQARQRALQAAVTAGANAFQLARDQYESGLVDFQTVLGTQQTLLTVQDTLASSQADMTSDLIRLYKALGGGWTPAAVEADAREATKE